MTSFVQPCDAGIIRCFKALYRWNFCAQAVDLDAAGEHNIYKLSLLEGMTMAKAAWEAVSAETIQHCWNHTKIQPDTSMSFHPAHMDPVAWDFIHQYATGTMTLPSVESGLRAHLRDQYIDSDWQPALKAVMEAEDNNTALDAISALRTAALSHSGIKIRIPTLTPAATESAQRPNQLTSVESEVMESV
ncbi:hypothetical protein PISMIDRAFT_119603 [Pisolithus microcarpus 441]|uniref:DDE-1 domain-containing protein n=1 Tax=Pisolithus microcarpus 441 TaxID=765257 RepID=A0A0C9YYZ9_9AGAM|nr:hypothetical protein PISMIDRAFT_119603 [Pisolithus microcarpus 441]